MLSAQLRVAEARSHFKAKAWVLTKTSTYGMDGIPVITSGTSLQGYPEALGKSLFLAPPEDAPALAGLIVWLYENRGERKERAEGFQAFVKTETTWNVVATKILDIASNDIDGVQQRAAG